MKERLKQVTARWSQTRWHQAVVWLLRLVLGGVFIFSGLAKAIDPWGSFYKFTEYAQAMHVAWGSAVLLLAAFAVAIVETMLGVLVLVGAYRRGAPVLLLMMMAVMVPLTLWLAVTDAVPDCGCFGDAWVISNTATAVKNVLLTLGLLYLLAFNRTVPSLYGPAVHWLVAALSFALPLALGLWGYFTQPLIDFRPFKVGTMIAPAADQAGDDDYVFIYSRDGVEHTFTMDSLPDEEDGWSFVDRRKRTPEPTPAQRAQQQVITLYDEGVDVTDEVLTRSGDRLLLLFPDLPHVDISATYVINQLNEWAGAHSVDVVGVTSGVTRDVLWWNDISMATYPMLMADDTDIKMVARGNPAVVLVSDGKVAWKRTLSPLAATPLDEVDDVKRMSDDFVPAAIARRLFMAYLLAMLALLVLNRFPKAVMWLVRPFRRRARKEKE